MSPGLTALFIHLVRCSNILSASSVSVAKDVLPASLISFGVIAEVCRIEAQLLGDKGA